LLETDVTRPKSMIREDCVDPAIVKWTTSITWMQSLFPSAKNIIIISYVCVDKRLASEIIVDVVLKYCPLVLTC